MASDMPPSMRKPDQLTPLWNGDQVGGWLYRTSPWQSSGDYYQHDTSGQRLGYAGEKPLIRDYTVDVAGPPLVTGAARLGAGIVNRLVLKAPSVGAGVAEGLAAGGAFSRIVPGGGLAAHEAAGGHLLARHVGQTEAALSARLAAQPRISAASSFLSRAEAEAGASAVLDARAADLATWVGGEARGRLVLDAPFSGGMVMQRGASAATGGSGVRLVLQGNGAGGWNILTGFPTP